MDRVQSLTSLRQQIGELLIAIHRERRRLALIEGARSAASAPYAARIADEHAEGTREVIAELEDSLRETRHALNTTLGTPLEVFATFEFSFVDEDGTRKNAEPNKCHRLPLPVAHAAVMTGVALFAYSIAGMRAITDAKGGFRIRQTVPRVDLPDVAGFLCEAEL